MSAFQAECTSSILVICSIGECMARLHFRTLYPTGNLIGIAGWCIPKIYIRAKGSIHMTVKELLQTCLKSENVRYEIYALDDNTGLKQIESDDSLFDHMDHF